MQGFKIKGLKKKQMEARKGKSKQNDKDLSVMISKLPEDLIVKILLHLPIEEAIRTCMYSRKWESEWKTLSSLSFSDESFISRHGEIEGGLRFINFVDSVIEYHTGSVSRFVLVCGKYCFVPIIYKWIGLLRQKNVRNIFVSIRGSGQVSSQLSSCLQFKHLEIEDFIVRVPIMLPRFELVTKLVLTCCLISVPDLERLISSCPFLKFLNLHNCVGLRDACLKIHANNLQHLQIYSGFEHVHLRTPSLVDATILLLNLSVDSFTRDGVCKVTMEETLGSLPDIKNLWITQSYLLRPLTVKFPPFNNLKFLGLHIDFLDRLEAWTALALIKSAPFLESLCFVNSPKAYQMEQGLICWKEVQRYLSLKNLKTIEIVNFVDTALLGFLWMAVGSAPVLRELVIRNELDDSTLQVLLHFHWASRNAEILFRY